MHAEQSTSHAQTLSHLPSTAAGMVRSAVAAQPSISSEGSGAQLVRAPSNSSRWGLTSAPSGALDTGAVQAQVRMKNRVIADLRSQKQQLTGVLNLACLCMPLPILDLNLHAP